MTVDKKQSQEVYVSEEIKKHDEKEKLKIQCITAPTHEQQFIYSEYQRSELKNVTRLDNLSTPMNYIILIKKYKRYQIYDALELIKKILKNNVKTKKYRQSVAKRCSIIEQHLMTHVIAKLINNYL